MKFLKILACSFYKPRERKRGRRQTATTNQPPGALYEHKPIWHQISAPDFNTKIKHSILSTLNVHKLL